ncbi:MAG: T9SS type A sorting domain-containing protein, partial [Candidatus Stygibacter frigidus]|nr:T9SS type A sorting domain-containing protein [Candidatus Stygibacter frigidus]
MNAIFSLEYDINAENLTVDLPEVINDDCLYNYNYNDNKFALISAAGIAGNIVRIPYRRIRQGAWNVHFQIKDNGNSYDLEYLPEEVENDADEIVENAASISSIYPNPFNPGSRGDAQIELNIAREELPARLDIYDIRGRKVSSRIIEHSGKITWDGKAGNDISASGMYLFKLITSSGQSDTARLLLIK